MLGVSYLLTLSVNKCDVILKNALFFSDLLGSIEAVKMSRSTFCLKYWSQFINHENLTISGIGWYIANVLMCCGFVSSVDQVVNCNHSEFLTSYWITKLFVYIRHATVTQDIIPLKSWMMMALIARED